MLLEVLDLTEEVKISRVGELAQEENPLTIKINTKLPAKNMEHQRLIQESHLLLPLKAVLDIA
jgi:hypothetical protein